MSNKKRTSRIGTLLSRARLGFTRPTPIRVNPNEEKSNNSIEYKAAKDKRKRRLKSKITKKARVRNR